MRVAVVTPYYREPLETLRHCQLSVARQTYPCSHVMVADGFPNPALDDWAIDHIRLPRPHFDIGSTPRLVGSYHAIGLAADAIAFLDADNWYRDDHIEKLVELHKRTGASFLSSGRMLCRIDGSVMAPCPHTDPEKFIDTSAMMFTRDAFFILAQWCLMPPYAHLIGDRVMLYHVKAAGVKRAHSGECSLFYRCCREGIYRDLGQAIPPGVSPMPNYTEAFSQWVASGFPALT
jgi:glycosyltransferase involved in cell wall biosynthesis